MSPWQRLRRLAYRATKRWRGPSASRAAATATAARPPVVPVPRGRDAWRAAVIGVGGWGQVHANVLENLPHVELVAVADRDPDALGALGLPSRVVRFDDGQALLDAHAELDLDLVTIAASSRAHAPLARAAVAAGVARVLVEKPIATALADADALIAEAEAAGVTVSCNLARRWSVDHAAIRAYLQGGELGPLRHVSLVLGRGGFGMSGIHFLDFALWLAGRPARRAWGRLDPDTESARWGAGLEDPPGFAVLELDDGARVVADLSADLEKRDRFFVLRAGHGRIEVDELARTWTIVHADGRRVVVPFRDSTHPAAWLRRHIVSLLAAEPPACPPEAARAALEAVIAVHRSHARDGAPVDLPLDGEARDHEVRFP